MLDPWQMLGLGMTYALGSCIFFLFFYFINRLLHVREKARELLPFLAFAAIFLCGGIAFIVVSWFDFYRWQYNESILPLFKIYTGLTAVSYVSLVIICEYILKKTKYLISIYGSILAILIQFSNNLQDINSLSLYFVPLLVIIPLLFYSIFLKPTSGFLRHRMFLALGGFFFMIVGFFGRSDVFTNLIGTYFYSVSTIFAIIGICIFGYGFAGFSTFTDFNWKKKLRELFIIADSGTCLYAFSFDQDSQVIDSDLIAGGFSGIQSLLSEMIKTTDSVQLIDYQNVKIMVEQRPNAMFVLIIKEESTFLRYKLRLFAEEFESFFKEALQHRSGQVDLFQPTKTLIYRLFEIQPRVK